MSVTLDEIDARILVVDDDPACLVAYEAALTDLAKVIRAGSGAEALERLLDGSYAAVLLDVSMPEMDGFETARLIRSRDRTSMTPVFFVTGIAPEKAQQLLGYGVGAVDYLLKPIHPEILRAKVAIFIELYRKNITLAREVAERRNAEMELARSNADLERFASVASHDLRQPLRGIATNLELLSIECGEALRGDARHYIDRARLASARAHALIDGVLAYSRAGQWDEPFEPVDLSGALRSAIDNLDVAIRSSLAEIAVNGPLPEVRGNRVALSQVLQNLLENAIKYRSEVPPRVRISAVQRDREWIVSVEDNGVGVDPAGKGRLFQLFQRIHGDAQVPGIGMGLATSRRIIERHGGRIWVEAAPTTGSIFRFSLPASGKESS